VRFLNFELEEVKCLHLIILLRNVHAQTSSRLSYYDIIVTWSRKGLLEGGPISLIQLEKATGDM